MRSERLKSAAFALVLFLLNLWLVRGLLSIEYLDEMGSIEGTHIALARWTRFNWGDLGWFPLWYGGIPFVNSYPPLLNRVVAVVSALTALTPAHAYHAATAVFYCLGPVILFALALRLSGSRSSALAAGLLYSLVSTSTLLIPAVYRDAGGIWGLRRLQALVQYGEGPHVASMTLLPLALLLLEVAFQKRRAAWWLASCLGVASVALTNWLGAAALALAVTAWLLSGLDKRWWRKWLIAAALGATAYMIAAPGIPPSAIRTVAHNERFSSGDLPAATLRLALAACGAFVVGLLLWAFYRTKVPAHIRFAIVFLLGVSSISLASEWLHFSFVPQPGRYHLEMEMALSLSLAFLGASALRRASPRVRTGVACLLLAWAAYGLVKCGKVAGRRIRPVDIGGTTEYRIATWLGRNVPGSRVMAPGSEGFFLNVFTDVPQFAGGVDQSVVNPLWTAVNYQIFSGENAGDKEGEVAIVWLKAFGVRAVAVSGPRSREWFKPFRNPRKFDGLLPELWREADDVIYRVPSRSDSMAHVIRPEGLAPRPPEGGLDIDPARHYVAALEDPSLPLASMKWTNRNHTVINTHMEQDQILSVQMSYHPGWRATVRGEPRRIYGDNLGQIVVEPRCAGPCTVDLEYDGGLEMLLARIASVGCLLAGICWILLHYLRYRS